MSTIITQPRGGAGGTTGTTPANLEFQETANVVANSQTTVFDYTNSSGNNQFLSQISAEGNARTEWFVLINNVVITKARSSVADLNIIIRMFDFTLADTDNIKVQVIHYEVGQFIDYSTTLNYHG